MATITNKTRVPQVIHLLNNKKLRLAPLGNAEISAKAANSTVIQKMVEAGTVAVLGVAQRPGHAGAGGKDSRHSGGRRSHK